MDVELQAATVSSAVDPGIDDGINVVAIVAGGVATGVKFSVQRLTGGRETRSTGSSTNDFR
jgi:hypothetical protein